MSDKKISEAAELLYKGGKMLTYHCPDCAIPLFEIDGKIFCPSCRKEAVFESDLKNRDIKEVESPDSTSLTAYEDSQEKDAVEGDPDQPVHPLNAERNLQRKIEIAAERICDMISRAENAKEVRDLTESLDRIVEIMRKLNR